MTTLKNARHEIFAQALATGKTQVEAYAEAGYNPHDGAAARLCGNVRISERVADLLGKAAARAEISVASVTAALFRIADKGEAIGGSAGLNVARAAYMDAAKLNGLVIERADVSIDGPAMTLAEFYGRHSARAAIAGNGDLKMIGSDN
jgi:hypothetical protein